MFEEDIYLIDHETVKATAVDTENPSLCDCGHAQRQPEDPEYDEEQDGRFGTYTYTIWSWPNQPEFKPWDGEQPEFTQTFTRQLCGHCVYYIASDRFRVQDGFYNFMPELVQRGGQLND